MLPLPWLGRLRYIWSGSWSRRRIIQLIGGAIFIGPYLSWSALAGMGPSLPQSMPCGGFGSVGIVSAYYPGYLGETKDWRRISVPPR